MFKIAICLTEKETRAELEQLFDRFTCDSGYELDVTYFLSADELFEQAEKIGHFHSLIIDLDMEKESGMIAAKKVRALFDPSLQIIFLTNTPECILFSFDVHPFHYLSKPLHYPEFQNVIGSLCQYIESIIKPFVLVKTNVGEVLLDVKDVVAIEKTEKNRVEIRTQDDVWVSTCSLCEFSRQLNHSFCKIYRSVIVNLRYVSKFDSNHVLMTTGLAFPLSRVYKRKIFDSLTTARMRP